MNLVKRSQNCKLRARGQRGQSLVEVVIAIVLASSIILVLAGGMFTINRTTVSNERIQSVDSALVVYGELLRSAADYLPCRPGFNPTTSNKPPLEPATHPNAGYMDKINALLDDGEVEEWLRPPGVVPEVKLNSLKSWDLETQQFVDGCLVPDNGVQLISYQVTYFPPEGDSITRVGQIAKRKQAPS